MITEHTYDSQQEYYRKLNQQVVAQQEIFDSVCNEDLGGKCTEKDNICGTPEREDLCGGNYKCCVPSVVAPVN